MGHIDHGWEEQKFLVIGSQKQENRLEGLSSLFHICLSGQLSVAQCTAAISHLAPIPSLNSSVISVRCGVIDSVC